MKKNERFKIYLAYPTNRSNTAQFNKIIQSYRRIGTEIQAYLIDWQKMDGLPPCDLYNPANHEMFITTAYHNNFITEADILSVNCEILTGAHLLIKFGSYKGRPLREVQYARSQGIPIYTMPDLSDVAIKTLRFSIATIVRSMGD
jgi:hypothetical protein